jgi:hypothetical protein
MNGFTAMPVDEKILFKLDAVGKQLNRIEEKTSKISDAIWEPDTGLFARVATNTVARKALLWIVTILGASIVATMVRVYLGKA